jgi:hypothetical protein
MQELAIANVSSAVMVNALAVAAHVAVDVIALVSAKR